VQSEVGDDTRLQSAPTAIRGRAHRAQIPSVGLVGGLIGRGRPRSRNRADPKGGREPEHVDAVTGYGKILGMRPSEHRARIRWSASLTQGGLPDTLRYVHPIRFTEGPPPWTDESWSLVCTFDTSPAKQGNPSIGRVGFLVDAAPHDRLKPGLKCWLYEGAAQAAVVEVLD